MKIQFDKHSYIEMFKEDNKIVIIVQAQDGSNKLKTISNACEITIEEFKSLYEDLKL